MKRCKNILWFVGVVIAIGIAVSGLNFSVGHVETTPIDYPSSFDEPLHNI
jgi:hypothetical protein